MPLRVKIKFFGEKDFKEMSLEQNCENLHDLLAWLSNESSQRFIKEGCCVIVNEQIVVNNPKLKDGDLITIMPILGGG